MIGMRSSRFEQSLGSDLVTASEQAECVKAEGRHLRQRATALHFETDYGTPESASLSRSEIPHPVQGGIIYQRPKDGYINAMAMRSDGAHQKLTAFLTVCGPWLLSRLRIHRL